MSSRTSSEHQISSWFLDTYSWSCTSEPVIPMGTLNKPQEISTLTGAVTREANHTCLKKSQRYSPPYHSFVPNHNPLTLRVCADLVLWPIQWTITSAELPLLTQLRSIRRVLFFLFLPGSRPSAAVAMFSFLFTAVTDLKWHLVATLMHLIVSDVNVRILELWHLKQQWFDNVMSDPVLTDDNSK